MSYGKNTRSTSSQCGVHCELVDLRFENVCLILNLPIIVVSDARVDVVKVWGTCLYTVLYNMPLGVLSLALLRYLSKDMVMYILDGVDLTLVVCRRDSTDVYLGSALCVGFVLPVAMHLMTVNVNAFLYLNPTC